MADFNELKAIIEEAIRENGREEITGDILQGVLLSIVDKLGDEEINNLYQAISDEIEARQGADNTLQGNIDAEELRAKGAERTNAEAIAAEENRAKAAERTNAQAIADEESRAKAEEQLNARNITAEEIRAKAAEKANADDIDIIGSKIPAQASAENQLADKQYVDDKVATDTATFRGTYNLVTDLELTILATQEQIATALASKMSALSIVPDNNDYSFVQIPTSDAIPTEIARIDRYKFNGNVWAFEYSLNNSGFTAAQWATINSGLVSGDKIKLDALPTNAELTILLNGKEAVTNKVTSISAESTDTQYPSAKAVWTAITAWLSGAMSWTAAQKKQARANLGFGDGDIDNEPTANSNNLVKSGGIYGWCLGLIDSVKEWANNIFAKIDGYYETMVVGAAKNLEGHNITEGTFFARPTGGENSELANGLAQLQAVKGNSVKYNQLVRNGNFANGTTGWSNGNSTINAASGVLTITPSSRYGNARRACNLVVGHKYCIIAQLKADNAEQEVAIGLGQADHFVGQGVYKAYVSPTDWTNVLFRGTYNETGFTATNRDIVIMNSNITSNFGNIYARNVMVFDLTDIFGAGNEPTAAQFEAWQAANWGAMEYYPNSEGAVLNVNMTGIESFKKNLLNPTTGKAYILGAYSETYGNYYGICGTYGTLTFKNAYGTESTITPDADGKFELAVAGELTVADAGADCAVFLWWDGTETEYSEYGSNIAKLDISHIYGKLNGAGELVRVWPTGAPGLGTVQDYLKIEDGAVVAKRVMGEVDMGSFPYNKSTGSSSDIYRFFSDSIKDNIKAPTSDSSMAIAVCGRWVTATQTDGYNGYKTDVLTVGTSGRLNVYPTASYTDGNAFRTAMSGVMLYYQLATPETYTDLVYMGSELFEDGTPVTLPVNYEADNWGIERVLPLNTPSAMVTSAPTIESKYSLDAVEQLDTHSAEIADLYNKNAQMDAKKANTVGSYEELVSGAALNLVGRGSVGAEYRFRPTAGSGSVGSGAAKITKMLGNTLVWNQLVQNGNFANGKTGWGFGSGVSNSSTSNGVLTVVCSNAYNGSAVNYVSNGFISGHKYYISFDFKSSTANSAIFGCAGNASLTQNQTLLNFTSSTTFTRITGILTANNNANIFGVRCDGKDKEEGFNWSLKNVIVFDLTLMFGAGNEPTAAQFEAMYPLDYYANNAGTLINNEATGIKTVGFNQWDEDWALGNGTGGDINYSQQTHLCSKNFIHVFPNTKYYFKSDRGGLYVYGYDANKQPLYNTYMFNSINNQEATIPAGVHYIKFQRSGGNLTYNNDICINLSWSGYRNGEYEAYWENILALNLKTLTGKLNGEGESIIVRPNGFEAVGTTADEGIVEGGNLTKINVKIGNQVINGAIGDTITLEGCKTSATSFLCASDIGTLSDGVLTLTAAATNVEVYYPLAQTKTYILDTPIPVVYREDDFGTEERLPEDTENSVTAPIKYEVAYPMDAVGTLTNLPNTYASGKEVQTFTSAEKEQARQNIGAASLADVESMFATLPTTDPQVAGKLWNDNGTVKISAGE